MVKRKTISSKEAFPTGEPPLDTNGGSVLKSDNPSRSQTTTAGCFNIIEVNQMMLGIRQSDIFRRSGKKNCSAVNCESALLVDSRLFSFFCRKLHTKSALLTNTPFHSPLLMCNPERDSECSALSSLNVKLALTSSDVCQLVDVMARGQLLNLTSTDSRAGYLPSKFDGRWHVEKPAASRHSLPSVSQPIFRGRVPPLQSSLAGFGGSFQGNVCSPSNLPSFSAEGFLPINLLKQCFGGDFLPRKFSGKGFFPNKRPSILMINISSPSTFSSSFMISIYYPSKCPSTFLIVISSTSNYLSSVLGIVSSPSNCSPHQNLSSFLVKVSSPSNCSKLDDILLISLQVTECPSPMCIRYSLVSLRKTARLVSFFLNPQ
ncbi:hypothetical protein VP01_111g5 [Puccinia sorghi]|uniref:Uncharacterized protein n=1 Tax=Puccinia sorghi TaxID=27349 RepID=A0A0L6VSC8_9BASI|nr:hypothetical protein VP01_111g5 [Puccinia sorghi]